MPAPPALTAIGSSMQSSSRARATERGVRPGDRVGLPWLHTACGECGYCLTGWETLCESQQNTGYSVDGGFADYTTTTFDELQVVVDALPEDPADYPELRVGDQDITLVVVPTELPEPPETWGWMLQLYALHSAGSWGMGDLGDLTTFLRSAGGAPIDIQALARQHSETVLAGLLTEQTR